MYKTLFLLFLLTACTAQKSETAGEILTDGLGRHVVLKKKPLRTLALAPSLTEMLFFVCDTAQIVGVTTNCNFPEAVKNKPRITTYPALDIEGILKLRPDVVFTMEGMTALDQAQRLEQAGIPVFYQKYEKVSDILNGIREIGRIMGKLEKANHLTDSLEKIQNIFLQETKNLPKSRVLGIISADPMYVYGKNTIFTDKLRLAGAINAVDTVFEAPFPILTREYVLKINPEVIIGGAFAQMDTTFFKLYPELRRISAYQNRRIFAVTDDLSSRPSPRIMQAIAELRRTIQ
jgi:iron complex transport system substrate-binding protein